MGDPAGIGAEVIVKALADAVLRHRARYIIYGMNEMLHYAADLAEFDVFWWRDQYNGRLRGYPHDVVVVDYDQYTMLGSAIRAPSKMGGEASMRFCLVSPCTAFDFTSSLSESLSFARASSLF